MTREEQNLSDYHIQLLFPSLSQIEVKGCRKLKSLFPTTIAQGLPELKDIIVEQCSQLEEVFQDNDGADSMDNKETMPLKLEKLYLKELPRLSITIFFPLDTSLEVSSNGSKKQHQLSLSSLKELWLMRIKELKGLCTGPRIILNLRNLTQLYINSCPELKYIFPLSVAQNLSQLIHLRIRDCGNLEQIIIQDDPPHSQQSFFPKLSQIDVKECNELRSLLPITIARDLQEVKDIIVEQCSKFEEVFGDKNDDKKIVLPKLENLCLKELPGLTKFCSMGYHFMISVLEIEGCQQQLWDGIARVRSRFNNLEKLIIRNCRMKMIFDSQNHELSLPNLEELKLEYLDELEGLCKAHTRISSLQKLTKLYISGCHNLKHIFSYTLAQNMSQLKELYIRDCRELKQVIIKDDEEKQKSIIVEDDEEEHKIFPELSCIYVRGCHKLKYLFPHTIVQGLQKLQDIRMSENSELEEIFGHKGGTDIIDDRKIVLPQLHCLALASLPSLNNFCPVSYHFIFPSLEELGIWECPKITTIFFCSQDKSVHVEPKVLQAESPPKPTMDIFCVGQHDLEETLPPYPEEKMMYK